MSLLGFCIICLAAWNISSLLVQEEGPFNIFARIRYWMGVDVGPDMGLYKRYGIGVIRENTSGLFMCVWCMSRWVAAILIVSYMVFPSPTMILCSILAVSTAVIAVDNWNSK